MLITLRFSTAREGKEVVNLRFFFIKITNINISFNLDFHPPEKEKMILKLNTGG